MEITHSLGCSGPTQGLSTLEMDHHVLLSLWGLAMPNVIPLNSDGSNSPPALVLLLLLLLPGFENEEGHGIEQEVWRMEEQ